MKYLTALFLAVLLVSISSCSRKDVFESEKAAKDAVAGKKASEVVKRLGAPDSIVTPDHASTPIDRRRAAAANPDPGSGVPAQHTVRVPTFTECWKYSRLVRSASGDLQTLNIFFIKTAVVNVTVGD